MKRRNQLREHLHVGETPKATWCVDQGTEDNFVCRLEMCLSIQEAFHDKDYVAPCHAGCLATRAEGQCELLELVH